MAAIESVSSEDTFRLREYFGVLWHRKWSLMAITLVAVLAAAAYTIQQTPMFTASVNVLATNPTAAVDSPSGGLRVPPNMEVERSLITALPVTQCATQILHHPTSNHIGADLSQICAPDVLARTAPPQNLKKNLNVVVPQDSTVMTITDTETSRLKAQTTVQAFALAYVNYKTVQARSNLAARRGPVQTQLNTVNKASTAANTALAKHLSAAATAGTQCSACQADTAKIQSLQQQQAQLNQQLINLSDTNLQFPQVLAPATYPAKASSPNKKLNLAAGLFAGLVLGIALAFLRERLDDRLRGRGDLEEVSGSPVLAVIPKVPGWRHRQEPKLVTLEQPKSTSAEAYRTLRTSILFAAAQRGLKTIMVCSPMAGDGKTTTASNLAVALADARKRVVLVSADLRKPRLHRFFGLENDVGLSNILGGEAQPWEPLKDPKVENLRVLTSGPVPARPGELLQSEQMGELLAGLREVADFVIIDTAPVLLVADAASLSPLVDGVLLVADAETSTRGSVAHAREQLEQVGAPLIGTVFNNFDPSKARYGYGSYRYYYGYGYRYGGGAYSQGYAEAGSGNGEAVAGQRRGVLPRSGRP